MIVIFQYDKLPKLVKDFEPFKNLWITASDWARWHESWMGDPLLSIDAESVEKNVNDSFKTMHKSVKIFNEIPGRAMEYLCFHSSSFLTNQYVLLTWLTFKLDLLMIFLCFSYMYALLIWQRLISWNKNQAFIKNEMRVCAHRDGRNDEIPYTWY